MRKWEVIINGRRWTAKACELHTAVSRCWKAYVRLIPKGRYYRADIFVKCLGVVK